ncbi:PREDICTED: CDK5RAP3-like protein [Ceratosolen solmsi marchali]|uniref:CDK5RAP3-like protein n=1 Tax=Ceratosolen solmsi marchali TaxID=326594 RepID=A0AAJ7DW18_9HYME|nr:PREDICTED: CDK5RAP3-like protein [Ceratosolen solmsi marchali]
MQEQDCSIVINTGKLFEWLVNRRHCKRDWQDSIPIIREKINNALETIPENKELSEILRSSYITYFHCLRIRKILDSGTGNGRLSSYFNTNDKTKPWRKIISLYEKDNVYLAEAAQMIINNLNCEIPTLKKQIQNLEQKKTEFKEKEIEYKRLENLSFTEYNIWCMQLGITGFSKKIKSELIEKLRELPDIYDKLAEKIKALDNVVEFYNAFVEFTLGHRHNGGCVPMIKYIIDKGNTTTYEWTYGECPLHITEPILNYNLYNDDTSLEECQIVNDDNKIDYSDLNLDAEINVGDENQLDGEIDWSGIDEDPVAAVEGDFDISLEESGVCVEDKGNDEGHATGVQALTVLDNIETRNDFINQLFELEAFLKLRLYEFKSNSNKNIMDISHLQESPILQVSTIDSIQNMLDNVQLILSEILFDRKLEHLHNIKHYPNYVDMFIGVFKNCKETAKKMQRLQLTMQDQLTKITSKLNEIKSLLKIVVANTRNLKNDIEKEISKMYNNRNVYLTGAINTL